MRPPHPARLTPLLLALSLVGCAGPQGPGRHGGEHRPAARPEPMVAVQVQSAELDGRPLRLTRSAATPALAPLVVFLPGLGQDGDAGARWVAAWAGAGYAVLSLQPRAEDASAWRSELARQGEFRELGRLHQGEAAQHERLVALQHLLARLRQAGVAPWNGLDWGQVVLAGYDLGAQTVLDWTPGPDGWQPRAVVAISPPPMQPATRLPALIITSDLDADPLGLVTKPADRQRSFEALPAGQAWLLDLPGVSHAGLAGNQVSETWAAQDQHRGDSGGGGGGGGRRGQGGGMGGGIGGGGQAGGAGAAPRGPRAGSATEAAQADLRAALRLSVAFADRLRQGLPAPVDPLLRAR
ncbi:MAG: hypothetical protein DI603_07935 [Roseateles depolymerans]|uniref:Alpha/beta hydrolase n=1 Tax=Roseateles depolymerans TaxID=76731 RepID=A0A2W5DN03_9BURK|nr:MAG: hypothetical protein DI603_07935 [Roseateles depolymerans]